MIAIYSGVDDGDPDALTRAVVANLAPRFGDLVPPTRYRPDIPQWLENIILKAVARDPSLRFETAEEMLLALEIGERKPLLTPSREPLAERDPLLMWQGIALLSVLANVLLMYLLIVS